MNFARTAGTMLVLILSGTMVAQEHHDDRKDGPRGGGQEKGRPDRPQAAEPRRDQRNPAPSTAPQPANQRQPNQPPVARQHPEGNGQPPQPTQPRTFPQGQPQQRAQQPSQPIPQRRMPQGQATPQQRAEQPRQQQPVEPPPQRSREQARTWQQQRGWAQKGAWQGRNTWQGNRAQHWATDHRTWSQRGGYGGYIIPRDRFVASFGRQHYFRLSRPVFYEGYPRFDYGGYSFLLVDPWPEYWANDWYNNDDVYIDYDGDGYYLFDRRYPEVRLAVTITL